MDKKYKNIILGILFGIILISGIYSYYKIYIPYKHLKEGFVIVKDFNCPSDHPIKANLKSKIFHIPRSTYYNKTNAANGYCFDTTNNAQANGFRKPYN